MHKKHIYELVLELGIEHDHHATDLYLPVTEQTAALVADHPYHKSVHKFKSQIDGKQWFDIPFAYLPGWGTPSRAQVVRTVQFLTPNQMHILCHSLGLDANGDGQSYRNRYCTAPGCDGYADILALRDAGLMKLDCKINCGKDELWSVTEAGQLAVRTLETITMTNNLG